MIEGGQKISHIGFVYNIASTIKNHRLYQDFSAVKQRLAAAQFVCWIAGGAVRDFCLEREVNEFDLVTDASTEILKKLFPEAVLVGESFGVLKLPLPNNEFFDLATFREEADYRDGRRPSHVVSSTPTQDSLRRDFTVNAMFWNDVTGTIVDYQQGLLDLERRQLVCVGEPEVRFGEDYLRIMRLARFSAQLGFEVEPETGRAALRNRAKINNVSGERLWSELKKIDQTHNWNFALGQPLFRSLLAEIFALSATLPERLIVDKPSIYLFIFLLDPDRDFSGLLKSRLKVSNAELQNYLAVRFLIENQTKFNVAQWSYELEKSPLFREQFQYLVKSGMMDAELDQGIRKVLQNHSEMLITAKELVDLIPNRLISEELKIIRINQFEKVWQTKAEVVEYLKKKYAN